MRRKVTICGPVLFTISFRGHQTVFCFFFGWGGGSICQLCPPLDTPFHYVLEYECVESSRYCTQSLSSCSLHVVNVSMGFAFPVTLSHPGPGNPVAACIWWWVIIFSLLPESCSLDPCTLWHKPLNKHPGDQPRWST